MLSNLFTLSNLRKAVRHPSLVANQLKKFLGREGLNHVLNRILYRRKYADTFDIMEGDWDNLIILDGCRYDYFEQHNTIEGDLNSILSQGSHSTEFLTNTFVDRTFHDTVYITANPHAPRLINDEFYALETLYDEGRSGPPREHFPDNVFRMSLPILEEYPDKKFLIHFMQPNVPFLGPTADQIRQRLWNEHQIAFSGMDNPAGTDEPKCELGTLKEACEKGYIDRSTLREAYEENVDIAIEHATKLLSELEGKTVITADHGEMLGERMAPLYVRQFGHDPELYTRELRQVPWLEIETSTRRETKSEQPVEYQNLTDDVVKKRLEHMGYTEYA